MGAPLNLVTARAERAEKCSEFKGRQAAASDEFSVMSVPAGPQCNSQTQGPGTICISKSSGRISASFNYRGTGSINGYIRIYQIDPATNGCPTGTTFQTGSTLNYTNNTTRTTSKTQTQNGAYSAHFWRETGAGNFANWGRTCGLF